MMQKFLLFLLVVVCFTTACQKIDELGDIDKVNYDAEFAVPLINTSTSIKDLLENFEENSTISIDPDGLIRFKYRGDVISKSSEDIFAEINAALPEIIPVTSPRMALPFTSPDGLDIDQLNLKGGTLIYFFQNDQPEAITVKTFFPDVKKDGVPLQFENTLGAYSGTGDLPFFTNLFTPAPLDGYEIVAENDSIFIEYEAITASGETITLPNFIINIQDFAFSYAEGYLGNQLHEGARDTIEIDFFESWVNGDVYFEDPKITFNFENSFGIPTRSIVNLFDVFTVRGEVLPLESDFVTNGINFPFPGLDEVGQVKSTPFVFTKENSNIDIVLGSGPIAVDYDVDAITNPDSNTDIRGFITDSSFYRVQVEVDLPLFARAVNFVARDTFEIDFSSYEDVDRAEFKLVTENSMPVSVNLQGYFLDQNGSILDSLLATPQQVIESAPVNSEGLADGTIRKETFAPYTAERFKTIQAAQKLAIVAVFSTINDGNQSVKITSQQDVKIKVGAKFGIVN